MTYSLKAVDWQHRSDNSATKLIEMNTQGRLDATPVLAVCRVL